MNHIYGNEFNTIMICKVTYAVTGSSGTDAFEADTANFPYAYTQLISGFHRALL
jgi:hypothetical protein